MRKIGELWRIKKYPLSMFHSRNAVLHQISENALFDKQWTRLVGISLARMRSPSIPRGLHNLGYRVAREKKLDGLGVAAPVRACKIKKDQKGIHESK